MKIIISFPMIVLSSLGLTGCIGCYNPNGCGRDASPYFYTTTTTHVRHLIVPSQSKLTYKLIDSKQIDQQYKALDERNLTEIELAPNTAMIWGGMPVTTFLQFFNSEFKGFTAYRVVDAAPAINNEFAQLWKSCDDRLDVLLKDPNDWSFNPKNMEITGCGVNIQKRSQYNDHWPNQDKADAFLIKINQALQKQPKQQNYPIVILSSK
ncbi:hypothetical protein [Acinetobacter venetianus]